jgi:hypothetical protein
MKRALKFAAVITLVPAMASAQGLIETSPIAASGSGLGNRITVLTLNADNSSNASGCITPVASPPSTVGTTGCGFANNTVTQQSFIRLVSELGTGSGDLGTDLRIIANFAEPAGSGATINEITLFLYTGTENTTATASFSLIPAIINYTGTEVGTGGEGFAFRLDAPGIAAFNAAVAGGATRIGLGAQLSNVDGAPDTFSLQRVNATTSVVPEPSTYALMAAGLAGIFVARRRRNRA